MSKRRSSKLMFEIFEDVNSKVTRLYDLVEKLREKRDFSDKGIEVMLKQQKIRPG